MDSPVKQFLRVTLMSQVPIISCFRVSSLFKRIRPFVICHWLDLEAPKPFDSNTRTRTT